MDPWADSSASWSPQERVRPASPRPSSSASQYKEGPVDPWAEPSSSSTLPGATSLDHERTAEEADDRATQPDSAGDFDPWGGNSGPIAPLSNNQRRSSESQPTDVSQNAGWSESNLGVVVPPHDLEERDNVGDRSDQDEVGVEPRVDDDDDPWGSGAAARRVKVEQEAEMTAQRMEILKLQEEAGGHSAIEGETKLDEAQGDERPTGESKSEDVAGAADVPAPVPSGWRSLFSRGASKTETEPKEAPKQEANAVKPVTDAKELPQPAAAPRLWQAPSLLGGHNRSTSSTSRSSATKEQAPATTAPTTQGPGWEVTTKKQQVSGGGLIQSLFGAGRSTDESETTSTDKTGLNRFGRALQRPAVMSAADEEDDSFDNEETGVEWDSGAAFEVSKASQPADLLSDEVEAKPPGSGMGKLLGRWLDRNPQASKRQEGGISGEDLSWLDGVGAGQTNMAAAPNTSAKDEDWLAFINQQPSQGSGSAVVPQPTSALARSMSGRYRVSSTAKGAASTKVPPLAPPPPATSPFSFRGPGQAHAGSSATRLPSGASAQTSSSSDTFGDFEQSSLSGPSPNPDEAYRDDENNSSLLKGTSQSQRAGGLLRGFQSRQTRGRYDYDENEVDSHDDSWSAFRDEPSVPPRAPYRDSQRSTPIPAVAAPSKLESTPPVSRTSTPGSSIPPPPAGSSRPQSWNRTAPLLPPPSAGALQPVGMHKRASQTTPAAKPTSLSQGKTLTSDDLSFFENL